MPLGRRRNLLLSNDKHHHHHGGRSHSGHRIFKGGKFSKYSSESNSKSSEKNFHVILLKSDNVHGYHDGKHKHGGVFGHKKGIQVHYGGSGYGHGGGGGYGHGGGGGYGHGGGGGYGHGGGGGYGQGFGGGKGFNIKGNFNPYHPLGQFNPFNPLNYIGPLALAGIGTGLLFLILGQGAIGRKKRSAGMGPLESFDLVFDQEKFLKIISAIDGDECIPYALCESAATTNGNGRDISFLRLFGITQNTTVSESERNVTAFEYKRAYCIGKDIKNIKNSLKAEKYSKSKSSEEYNGSKYYSKNVEKYKKYSKNLKYYKYSENALENAAKNMSRLKNFEDDEKFSTNSLGRCSKKFPSCSVPWKIFENFLKSVAKVVFNL